MKKRLGIRIGKRGAWLTLRGERGRALRILLYCVLSLAALIAAVYLLKPEKQLMNSAEVRRITDRGMLTVGVRSDIPGFSMDGEGLETELAEKFARFLLPENAENPVKLVTVSAQTASTKLSDGSIDVAIALMQRGASSKFAYSYPYFTDKCRIAVKRGAGEKPLDQMLIGYVQNTSGARVLLSYIDAHETKVETSLIDRLRGIKKELPEDAVTFDKKAFASYPDMLTALSGGIIDCAVLPGVYAELYSKSFDFALTDEPLGSIEYSIAASADEPAIASLADVFIYELRRSGELDKLMEKYSLGE